MDAFPDVRTLSDAELKDLVEQKLTQEREVSRRRRVLQGQIDVLRAERARRLKRQHGTGAPLAVDSDRLSEAISHGGPRSTGSSWAEQTPDVLAGMPDDLGAVSDDDLRRMIDERAAEEEELSFDRRMQHGHIDMLHAEVEARLQKRDGTSSPELGAIDVERIAAILAHRGPPEHLGEDLAALDEDA